jgi:hypothetical protein
MVMSRRKFLQAGSVVALVAGFPLKAAFTATGQQTSAAEPPSSSNKEVAGAATKAKTNSLTFMTKATFDPLLNTAFVIQSRRTRPVEVTLVQVNSTGPTPDQHVAGKECFALVFRGQQRLPQDVYSIQHPALGKFDLLIVPVGKDKKGKNLFYEAVINRLN